MKTKKILTTAAVVLFIIATLWLLQRLVVPKYMGDVVEGNFIAEYYDEEKDHDVRDRDEKNAWPRKDRFLLAGS